MLDRVGQQIGNYRLLRILGQGAFAQVYLGEHCYLNSSAALKVLWQHSLSEQEVQRFLEEAQMLVRLRHVHIVRVLDFAIEQGTPVLIMDYLPGGTLRQRYPHGTRLSLKMTAGYIMQLASALQYAHNRHLIHRDVKPENILLDEEQQLQLSDFGLALLAPSIDQLSTQPMAGTPLYLAPEQIRGKPSFASDQYALGILTYEWLTGARPFQGGGWELIQRHLMEAPPPLREHRPELPAAVEQVVLKALSKDPRGRYVSVSAFALALERAWREGRQDDEEEAEATVPLRVLSRASVVASMPSYPQVQTSRVVFLSAAPGDEQLAARLAADLSQRGIAFSNDRGGASFEQDGILRGAMSAARQVVVVGTQKTRFSRRVKEHLRLAQMYQRRLVLVWMRGEEMAALLLDPNWQPFLPVDVVDARQSRYQTALDELMVCLREGTHVSPYEDTTLPTAREPRNPYKGLRAFRQEDTSDFFGRDALVQEAVKQLSHMLTTPHYAERAQLLTVVGPSGSGKSSVVLAGLLPHLQAGALPGSETWVYLQPIVPGIHPFEALALTLASHFSDRPIKAIREDLQDDSARGLHLLAMELAGRPERRVVLVIDQFEELFSQAISEEERNCFVDLLLTAVTEATGPVLVLLTLRADFYDRLMRYPYLYRLIEAYHQPVLPMEIQELRQVIEEPAALPDVRLTFEGNLVGDLLFETQGQAGTLPLLEFTLDQLFQRREGQTLTLAAYREMGGVKGALAKHAESTYASLPSDEHRSFAQMLFMRLVNLGTTEQDTTRRRAALSELSLPDAKQAALLREVADTFITARLLTTSEFAGVTTIEVSHEALIREWARLSNWLGTGREDIRLQQAVSQDVVEWEQRGRPRDRLYQGSQLKEAKIWARRNIPSEQEAAFLRAGAFRQMRFVVSMIVVFLLLISTAGIAVRLFLLIPPDPTLVTNREDDGTGSLRWATIQAKAGSTIRFAPDVRGTIFLKSNDLVFSKDLIIHGPGAGVLTISGGNSGNIVWVLDRRSVTMSGLSFKNSNTGKTKVGFIDNDGTLTLTNTTVSGNTSSSYGGGVFNNSKLALINSTISNNSASYGGGIYNFAGTLTVINSTISGNKASGAQDASGGGILTAGELTLINSTVSGNTTSGKGGGITVSDSQATITSCTIYDNKAQNGGGFSIQDSQAQSHVEIGNSIIAGNHAPVGADISGTLTSDGYNLIQNISQASLLHKASAPTDLIGIAPDVGPLQDNGGLTRTQALLPGSPAIDKIPRSVCHLDTISTDQRGTKRPQGPACDIGAYEQVYPH